MGSNDVKMAYRLDGDGTVVVDPPPAGAVVAADPGTSERFGPGLFPGVEMAGAWLPRSGPGAR